MARLDPRESFEALKAGVTESIQDTFPIEGAKNVLELESVDIDDNVSSADYTAQKAAKLSQRTFGIPVKATMVLKDKATGQVLDRGTHRIATLPKITNRYSYIVNGSEFQVKSQFRLRPGAYTKIKEDGGIETFFNVKGRPLNLGFDPESRKFHLTLGGANPPLYPILKAMGVSDDTLEKQWGKDILAANRVDTRGRPVNVERTVRDFAARLDPHAEIRDANEAAAVVRDRLEAQHLHPEVTRRTLGKSIDRINADAVLRSTGRILGISRGQEQPDVRDSLIFKDFHGMEDFMKERVEGTRPVIQRRIRNNLDRRGKVKDMVGPDVFGRPINDFFGQISLASTGEQTNPLRMIGNHMGTTITGEGGVSAHKITEDAKLVDPSHFGVLDPLDTPEGEATGLSLQLSLGAKKTGRGIQIPLVNTKTGKTELVSVDKAYDSTVALPDSVRRTGKGFVPVEGGRVLASVPGNDVRPVRMSEVDYVVPRSAQMFGLATNLIPFLSSDSPNRATMAGRHMSQAIPVEDGEAPLVQSAIGGKAIDDLIGSYASHHAPVGGRVTAVTPDAIVLKDASGKKVEVPIYNHYPLNDKTGFMHSKPLVRVGDEIKSGQLIADSNFTRNGQYAVGKNLTVAYIPWKGATFEDGVAVSETASRKMTSVHMHRPSVSLRTASLDGTKKYRAHFNNRMTNEQAEKLDKDGVIQIGQKVKPGDTLIAAMADRKLTTEEQKLQLLHKSLVSPKKDMGVVWDEDYEGEVVGVNRRRDRVEVHVKTRQPIEVGDKISARAANKGIVTRVIPDNEMPRMKDGTPIDILMNPIGVAGRMNVGQLLETAMARVAEKRGKPVLVENFALPDNLDFVTKELKREGISEKEDLIDPTTGRTIPKVFTGKQYVFKLEHQVDKKMAARSRAAYDHNLVPRGGGKHGAQAFGSLGTYAMLAHGARSNLREAATWKSDKMQGGIRDELWGALQAGEMLPPPRPTFAYNKFLGYLKGLGLNTEGDGNSLNLIPLTDKDVLEMSKGELRDAGRMIRMKDQKPERGGLFDEKITGGMSGQNWSHIRLAAPMPNPVFERAIMALSGIRAPQYASLISGEHGVTKDGQIVTTPGDPSALYGPASLERLLGKIDVKRELEQDKARLGRLSGQVLNETRRRVKYLQALDKLQMSPTDAYMMRHVPVLPPSMRPLAVTDDGRIQTDDLNELYKGLALVNMKVGQFPAGTPRSLIAPVEADIYDHLKALSGLGGTLNDRFTGIIQTLSGTGRGGPKKSYVQDVLFKRKQDLTMRSTIVPNPGLSLDEVELPRKAAKEMYKPFVVRDLRRTAGVGPLEAKKMIDEDDPLAQRALDRVVQERPVMLKRDPALHKWSVQAFTPRLTESKTIGIHPLVCSGYNADFDGNCLHGGSKIVLIFPPEAGITTSEGEVVMKFAGETRVFSSDGQVIVEMEIRDVPRSDKPIAHDRNGNPVYGLPPGTLVLSYDHARHQPLFTEATGLTIEQACETVQVRGRSCEVVASSNESLCLYDHETGEVRKCSPLGSEGRLMPVVRRIPLVSAGEHDFYYGWMIGAFASDGFFMGDREHIIGYSKVSSAHRDRFFAALRQHEPGQLRRATYATTHGPDDDVEGESVKDHIVGIDLLLSVFKDCYHPSLRVKKPGERAALYKKLPADLGAYSLDALHGVLSGLLDGDGHVSKDVKGRVIIQIGTSSPYLVASVEVLCSLLGIRCGVTSVEPVAGRVQKHTAYIITLSRIDVEAHVFDIDLVGDGDTILQEMRLSRWAGATFKDDRDVVPIPFKILEFLASTRGPAERGLQRVLATTKSKTRRGPYTSRATARRMLGYLPESFEGRAQWEALVTTTDVHWDVIQSVEDYGTIEVFDLIVPETKVFVANGGLVVWDTMSAYVPISNEAVREAQSMFPSRNLFNAATHRVMYTPDKEMQVGLYMASEIGKRTNKSFKSEAELDRALAKDEVGPNDVVTVPGPGGKPIRTTASRLKIGQHLPDQLRDQVLTNLDLRLTKKEQGRLFQQMAEVEGDRYPERINGLKNVGNETVTMGGFTIGLEDLRPLKELREPLLRAAKAKASKLDLRKPADAQRYVDIYADAAEVLDKKLDQAARDPSNKSQLARLQVAAGIKGGGFKQLVGAPVLFVDGKGEVVPNAVTTSYSEGLRTLPYWSATSGGRKGIVQKVQSVREPGYLTKLMTNSTLNQIVDTDDCETSRGIALRIDDPDVLGRYTTASLKLGHGKEIPAGTLLTDDILSRIRNNDPRAKVVVRSPMRCDHTTGVCARCMGLNENGRLHDLGTNVGVLASQALGERGTQLALRSFHCSHAKTLVTVRNHEQQRPLTVSLEHLFDIVGGEIIEEEGSELRICDPDQGWLIYQGSGADHAWTELLQVRRHAPTRPMKMLSDMSGVLICQDNHPVPARPNLVRCERCGYHRLKKPSPRAMHTSGKWYCPKCHRYQHPAPERWGEQDFLPAAALESKRFYVERDLLPPHGTGASFWMDPYRAGAYVAEAFPSDFLSYSDSDLALALCGLIDGDGTSKDIDRADRIAIDTTSFELAQQIVMICARLGIVANLVATKVRSLTRNQGFRVVLRITLRAQSLLAASLKLRRVKVPSPAQEPELTGPHLLTTVRDVLYTDSYVYDVTTASGVFVGGGLLNHNSGGVFEGREATSKSLMAGGLDRALGLLYLTQNVKGSTTLATRNGEVESVKKDPAGGWDVRIGGQRHYVSSDVQVSVKPGDKVRRGDALATGYVNPHHLLPLAGLDRTQGYLAQQLHGIYSQEGIRRRNSELMVRAISGVTQIEDPGDHPTLLRGDMASTPGVAKWNRDTAKAGKQPVRHSPVLRGVKLLPLDMQEDWMARLNHERLKGTLLEAAQQGWTAQMHGPHPIPPLLQGAEFGKGTKEKPWQY